MTTLKKNLIEMAKLKNKIEYENVKFPAQFGDYLLSNAFSCIKQSSDTLQFVKGNICLMVKGDCVDYFRYEQEREHDKIKFLQSHTGISQLDNFGWIMLLQIMKVQKANHHSLLTHA